jgi:hypothetical protein
VRWRVVPSVIVGIVIGGLGSVQSELGLKHAAVLGWAYCDMVGIRDTRFRCTSRPRESQNKQRAGKQEERKPNKHWQETVLIEGPKTKRN